MGNGNSKGWVRGTWGAWVRVRRVRAMRVRMMARVRVVWASLKGGEMGMGNGNS